ncbi:MAG: myxococcus cysteine-rich repeat containing protein, partial [Proteobacteria bacterium]|nr:myxococcus cysteine-rich repeat containing protein [Pseudomonadota bacterium]
MKVGTLAVITIGVGLAGCSSKSGSEWDRSEFEQQLGTCGDGTLDFSEQCDDTNTADNDGCSATCRLEPGYACRPGHACEVTTCEVLGGGAASTYLRGNFLEMGLGPNAAFGAGEVAPVGWHGRTEPNASIVNELGFVSDPDASQWTNYHGDFFTPGTPEEGWGVEYSVQVNDGSGGTFTQTYVANNNRVSAFDIPGTFDTPTCHVNGLCRDRGGATVTWTSSQSWNGLAFGQTYTIVDGGVFIIVDVDVTNTGETDLADIYYMRNVDPDNDVAVNGDYTTVNTIVSQPDATSDIALVRADQSQLSNTSAIALVANDPRARVAIGG